MTITSTFPRLLLPVALFAAGCGDDEGADVVASEAGESTATLATSSAESAESTVHVEFDASVSACAALAGSCKGSTDPIAVLCGEIANEKNDAECELISNTCTSYCEMGTSPSNEPSAAQCSNMGHKCHDYDNSSGLGYLCHKVDHDSDLEACSVIYSACATLCDIEPSNASASHHDSNASHHDDNASAHAPHNGGPDELNAAAVNAVNASDSLPPVDA